MYLLDTGSEQMCLQQLVTDREGSSMCGCIYAWLEIIG